MAVFRGSMDNVNVATPTDEHHESANDSGCGILYNPRVVLWLLPLIEVLAAFIGTMISVNITVPKNTHHQSINNFW
jgi:hypothetical protein